MNTEPLSKEEIKARLREAFKARPRPKPQPPTKAATGRGAVRVREQTNRRYGARCYAKQRRTGATPSR